MVTTDATSTLQPFNVSTRGTSQRVLDVRLHPCSDRGLRMRSAEEFVGSVIGIEENIHEPEIAGDDAMSFAIAK